MSLHFFTLWKDVAPPGIPSLKAGQDRAAPCRRTILPGVQFWTGIAHVQRVRFVRR
jgi:hypothetical protein